jgi:hypothetical protein
MGVSHRTMEDDMPKKPKGATGDSDYWDAPPGGDYTRGQGSGRAAVEDRRMQAAREAMSRVEGKTNAKRKLPIPGRPKKLQRMPRKSPGLAID